MQTPGTPGPPARRCASCDHKLANLTRLTMKVGNFEILVRTTQGSPLPELSHGPETYVVARSGSAFTVHVKRGEDDDGHTPCVKVRRPLPHHFARNTVIVSLLSFVTFLLVFTCVAGALARMRMTAATWLFDSSCCQYSCLRCICYAYIMRLSCTCSIFPCRPHRRAGCLCSLGYRASYSNIIDALVQVLRRRTHQTTHYSIYDRLYRSF